MRVITNFEQFVNEAHSMGSGLGHMQESIQEMIHNLINYYVNREYPGDQGDIVKDQIHRAIEYLNKVDDIMEYAKKHAEQ